MLQSLSTCLEERPIYVLDVLRVCVAELEAWFINFIKNETAHIFNFFFLGCFKKLFTDAFLKKKKKNQMQTCKMFRFFHFKFLYSTEFSSIVLTQ